MLAETLNSLLGHESMLYLPTAVVITFVRTMATIVVCGWLLARGFASCLFSDITVHLLRVENTVTEQL